MTEIPPAAINAVQDVIQDAFDGDILSPRDVAVLEAAAPHIAAAERERIRTRIRQLPDALFSRRDLDTLLTDTKGTNDDQPA